MNEWDTRLLTIANRAVHKAQEENRRNGVPNVYVVNGTIVWQLPDETITTVDPLRQPAAAGGSPGIRYGLAKGKYRLAGDIDAGNAEVLRHFREGEP